MTLDERIAVLETRLQGLAKDVQAMHQEIHGPPRNESIRGRLHYLEDSERAVKLAQATLETAKSVQARTWSRRRQLVVFSVGLVTAAAAVGGFVLALIAATT